MTKEQLNQFIKDAVLKEVRATVPHIVRDVMSKMLMEVAMSRSTTSSETLDNSHKRRALSEVSYMGEDDMEDYPTMPMGAAQMARLRGMPQNMGGRDLIVSEAITEHGTAIPVNPEELPDHVVRALTRNYSDVMQALEKKRG